MRHHGNLACVEDMGLLEQSVEHVKPVLEKIHVTHVKFASLGGSILGHNPQLNH